MASAEIVSNLKLITSGKVPTTSNLGNGELAFGLVDGVAKLYGNVNGTIVDFSDFLQTAPVTSVAGKTGAVTLAKGDVGLENVDNVKQYSASNPPPYPVTSVAGKTGAVTLQPSNVGNNFEGMDGVAAKLNVGTAPAYPGTKGSVTFTEGFGISQGINENSGIWFDGDGINMWSPCDRDAITYYDEDDGSKVFRVTSSGIVYRKDGKRALYEGEAGGGGTPYVTTISSWSGSRGNYYKQITAATHGKGAYPSVHTYVQNGSLWEETYDSPAIDSSGNVTVYTNSAISIKVVIK